MATNNFYGKRVQEFSVGGATGFSPDLISMNSL